VNNTIVSALICSTGIAGRFRRLHGLSRGLPLGSSFLRFVTRSMGNLTDLVSGGRALWSPSLEVIARKK